MEGCWSGGGEVRGDGGGGGWRGGGGRRGLVAQGYKGYKGLG